MPTIILQGTKFTCNVCQPKMLFGGGWARLEIGIENDSVKYFDTDVVVVRAELEAWCFEMRRFLAGAYTKERSLIFEGAGFSVDFFVSEDVEKKTRQQRREEDCIMAVRLLMRSKDKSSYMGGVYTLLLHRAEIEKFSKELYAEFEEKFIKYVHGRGKFAFAGVSPLGAEGCNYWYLDDSRSVKKGDYVWVKMGRHNTEQIVRVDSVRLFTDITAPYNPASVKRVLRIATEEEILALKADGAFQREGDIFI